MAPKKAVSEVAPSWLESVFERWDHYFSRMDKLFEILVTIQQSQNNILNRIASIESKLETSRGEQQTCPHSAVYSALVKFKADKRLSTTKPVKLHGLA